MTLRGQLLASLAADDADRAIREATTELRSLCSAVLYSHAPDINRYRRIRDAAVELLATLDAYQRSRTIAEHRK